MNKTKKNKHAVMINTNTYEPYIRAFVQNTKTKYEKIAI